MIPRRFVLPAALACVPASFAAGAVAARAVLAHATPAIATDLAQPLVVVTAWHGLGAWMWAVLAATVAAAAAAALVALAELRRGTPCALAAIVAAAAAALACALAWPAVFSSDVYAYAAYGDLAARGLDPYARVPAPAGSALAAAAAWQWGGATPACVYGPAFVGFARLLVVAGAQLGTAATLLLFRLVSCVAFLAAAAFLYAALPGGRAARTRRLTAAAAVALNPVALWCVAEGHNDALMLAVALAGAAFVRGGAVLLGGTTIALSSLVKAPGILVGAAVALAPGAPARMRRLAAGLAAGAAVVALAGVPAAVRSLGNIGRHGHYQPQYSLQALGVLGWRSLEPSHALAAGAAIALALCAVAATAGIAALRARDASTAAWFAIVVWLALPNPYPWYALWVLPVAALALDQPPFAALWAATISIVVRYLPDAFGSPSPDQQAVITVLELAPLLYALRAAVPSRTLGEAALP